MFLDNRLPLLNLLQSSIYGNLFLSKKSSIYGNLILTKLRNFTKGKVKDKEHLKLRCLVQVGLGLKFMTGI